MNCLNNVGAFGAAERTLFPLLTHSVRLKKASCEIGTACLTISVPVTEEEQLSAPEQAGTRRLFWGGEELQCRETLSVGSLRLSVAFLQFAGPQGQFQYIILKKNRHTHRN